MKHRHSLEEKETKNIIKSKEKEAKEEKEEKKGKEKKKEKEKKKGKEEKEAKEEKEGREEKEENLQNEDEKAEDEEEKRKEKDHAEVINVAKIFCVQVHDIDILFDEIYPFKTTLTLYNSYITHIWIQAYVLDVDMSNNTMDLDDETKILSVHTKCFFERYSENSTRKFFYDILQKKKYVTAICKVNVMTLDDIAILVFHLVSLSDYCNSDSNSEITWNAEVIDWFMMNAKMN